MIEIPDLDEIMPYPAAVSRAPHRQSLFAETDHAPVEGSSFAFARLARRVPPPNLDPSQLPDSFRLPEHYRASDEHLVANGQSSQPIESAISRDSVMRLFSGLDIVADPSHDDDLQSRIDMVANSGEDGSPRKRIPPRSPRGPNHIKLQVLEYPSLQFEPPPPSMAPPRLHISKPVHQTKNLNSFDPANGNSQLQHPQQRALQEAPPISDVNGEIARLSLPSEFTPQQDSGFAPITSPGSFFEYQAHDYTGYQPKQSPQLPPPGFSAKRLTLTNGEDFAATRRGLATDLKAPAEYTLHIIFTQFVRHAERKLNLFLGYPLDKEPPINDLLAEGVDVNFDQIISALGYVARRKPKPVIDLVMFWRKSKSEVATLATTEAEQTLEAAKQSVNEMQPPQMPLVRQLSSNSAAFKRSLSLMRSKSFSRSPHRRNQSTPAAHFSSNASDLRASPPRGSKSAVMPNAGFELMDTRLSQVRETAIQADRKSLASIYILCRVLIEVVKQTSSQTMGADLDDKLEQIVYTQLKTTDPVSTAQSMVRSANWNLFAELLGVMSEKRFVSVSDRCISDLEKIPSHVLPQDEPRLHMLIHGMRYLRLTNYPVEAFEESAEFILSLSKFFGRCQNETLAYAYCEVLSHMLLPMANVITAETNHPIWVEATEFIFSVAHQIWVICAKGLGVSVSPSPMISPNLHQKHAFKEASFPALGWTQSLQLMTSALAVSRKQFFTPLWFDIIEDNAFILKPKSEADDKTAFITCTARLVWVYLFRLPDTLNNTVKKVDRLCEIMFFATSTAAKKSQWLTADPLMINSLVELIRIVGFNHLNYVLDNIITKVVSSAFNSSTQEISSPEKLILMTRAYLAVLRDTELAKKPVFPTDEELYKRLDENEESSYLKRQKVCSVTQSKDSLKLRDFGFAAKNSKNAATHEDLQRSLGSLLKLLDSQYGCTVWVRDHQAHGGPGKQLSSFSSFLSLDFSYGATKELHLELLSTLIEAIPWAIAPISIKSLGHSGILFKSIVDILARNAVHEDTRVSSAAINALDRLASRSNPSSLIAIFAKVAFQFTEKPTVDYNVNYLKSREYKLLLKIYVELLLTWLENFKSRNEEKQSTNNENPLAQEDEAMNKDTLNDLYQINHKNEDLTNAQTPSGTRTQGDELEWKTMFTVFEEVEGYGLFFLCSQDPQIRHYATSILKLVEQFDHEIYRVTDDRDASKSHSRSPSKYAADVGARLINVLHDTDFNKLIMPLRKGLSGPERNRLVRLKDRSHILVRLAESDYGIDSTIWFRVYPQLLEIFFQKCPMPVAMCRLIVCVRLVQMHESVSEFSDGYQTFTSSILMRSSGAPPEMLVNQWRLYLIYACSSMTSTNEQKISFPNKPTHGRKRSMQIYIQHQTITSAKSIFRMVLPLLESQNPMVRNSVVLGLSCSNINIFRALLESLPQGFEQWDSEIKSRGNSEDRLRCEIVHILANLTELYKDSSIIYQDEWIMTHLIAIIKNVKGFLSAPTVQRNIAFQHLRRYFCSLLENVMRGTLAHNNLNEWLPFEARLGSFNYMREWSGYGDDGATEAHFSAILDSLRSLKDQVSALAVLELERKLLLYAASSCMAVICSGPISYEIEDSCVTFGIKSLMRWVWELAVAENDKAREIGRTALTSILRINLDNKEVILEIVGRCFNWNGLHDASAVYFTLFAAAFMNHQKHETMPYRILCLANWLVGSDQYEVRRSAIDLICYLEATFAGSSTTSKFVEFALTKTKAIHKKSPYLVSAHWDELYPHDGPIRISYFTEFFNLVDRDAQDDVLACLLPCVLNVILEFAETPEESTINPELQLTPVSKLVLSNLFEVTAKSSGLNPTVEALWIALASNPVNLDKIFTFIIAECLVRRNPGFVKHAQLIVDFLALLGPNLSYFVDKFIENLQPKSMVPRQVLTPLMSLFGFPYVADLSELVDSNEKDASFSSGQLSLVMLVDLFTGKIEHLIERLPLLLHISFSLLDHYLGIVQTLAVSLLLHLINSLVPDAPKSAEIVAKLRQNDLQKHLWVYDDLDNNKIGARTPKNMDLLVRDMLDIFLPVCPMLQSEWSRVSLNWATTCPVRHIACRSFQTFRSLLLFIDLGMLKDMLHRLCNTISDESHDIQGFTMQILMTLNAVSAELSLEKLIDFPQLFWSSVACLTTVHEQEYIEVLSSMSKFVSKIDLDAPDTVSCLISTFPPKWEGNFEGLQKMVVVGLRSATSWEASMKFLDNLNKRKDSEIIGNGDSRLLIAVLSNLPRFLHAFDRKIFTAEIEEAALSVSALAELHEKPGLARILESYAKNRFRSKKDFLVQCISSVRSVFFPQYEAQALVLLLGFLSNTIEWIRLETMSVLKQIIPLVDLTSETFKGVGADLILPLLRLLLTDYAEPALEVLDEMAMILGSQLDKDALRMSLGNSSTKREHENTATLFGIPEESGWAIPMPAVTSGLTRNNVHLVFATCAVTADEQPKVEEFEFHLEDYYAEMPDYADTVSYNNAEEREGALSSVWAALDSFDSFFTKDAVDQIGGSISQSILKEHRDYHGHKHSASTETRINTSLGDPLTPLESVPTVYDNKASLILNRSLARTKSNSLFKSSFVDSDGNISPTSTTMRPPSGGSNIRSYLPFRNSRQTARNRNDGNSTPVSTAILTFGSPPSSGLFRTSHVAQTPMSLHLYGPTTPNSFGISESPQRPSTIDSSTRFEHLLGGGSKKKLRKGVASAPETELPPTTSE